MGIMIINKPGYLTAVTLCVFICGQQEEVRQKAKDLGKTVSRLQKCLAEGAALIEEKDMKLEMKAKREKELIASVHRYIIKQYLRSLVKLKHFNYLSQFTLMLGCSFLPCHVHVHVCFSLFLTACLLLVKACSRRCSSVWMMA